MDNAKVDDSISSEEISSALRGSSSVATKTMIDGVEEWPAPDVLNEEFITNIPPRKFLLAGAQYMPGEVTALVAPGGTSKTTKLLQDCISFALGYDLIEDAECEHGNALFINMEESTDEIRRKCAGILKHFGRTVDDRKGELFIYTADSLDLKIAERTEYNQASIILPQVEKMIEFIETHDISFVCIDPFIRVHSVQENDNDQMDVAVKALMQVARKTGVALGVGHHSNKSHAAGSDNAARGASAFRDACRLVLTLSPMSDKDAEKLISKDEAYRYVALDGAKANYTVKAGRVWYERISVPYEGDTDEPELSVPVLVKCNPFALWEKNADLRNHVMREKLARWMLENDSQQLSLKEAVEKLRVLSAQEYGREPGINKAREDLKSALPNLGETYGVFVRGKVRGLVRERKGHASNSPIFIRLVDDPDESDAEE